ncbi:uncharacterized protein [Centruroides vittatus]|uniref:uncharacterized protein n=1 Tax=Centruroides vittatus TaxID=120091 RepID=UPI00350F811B
MELNLIRPLFYFGLYLVSQLTGCATEAVYDVTCSPKMMKVTVYINNSDTIVYLERLKGYSDCEPELRDGYASFRLPLDNIYSCGTTKMLNKLTGQRIYYHRVILEHMNKDKEVILVRCVIPGDANKNGKIRNARNTLPEDFFEPTHVNITDYIEAHAAVPYLSLTLKQNGRFLDTTLNVQPGTPLEMMIFLDKKSSETYGLLASYLKVTDNTPDQEEIIIMNGCSIDPYIFGNFETNDNGKTLSAKFRAFKFPESNYVLFVGTVNVCLQQCKGVPCGNDQFGYGRKKREIPAELPQDPNRVFEVEMTAFLKVEYDPNHFSLNKGSIFGKYDDAVSNHLTQTEDSSSSISPILFLIIICVLLNY